MSAMANRTRGAVPTKFAVAAAALALLATPLPAGAHGTNRTVLLSLTDSSSLSALADRVNEMGGNVLESMEIAGAMLVQLPSKAGTPAGAVEVPNVPMTVNGTRTFSKTTVNTYRETIGADESATGAGVKVALVDTGIGGNDGLGHGTFLAGLIKGVAPAAEVVDVKVADDEGNTSLAQVLSGLQEASDKGADVVNVSLSTGSPLPPTFDPLSRALDNLWNAGVTVVTASGNDGPDKNTVTSPGNDPLLLTVGALDEAATPDRADDSVAEFSSRGTKFNGGKPDLVAPGVSLISDADADSIIVAENPDALVGAGQMRGSGTSMSAAVVSGAAAVVLSVNSALTPDAVKALFMDTAYTNNDLQRRDGAGAGALDLAAAVAAAPTAKVKDNNGSSDETVGEWGPADEDAAAWELFAAAWEAGDFEAAKAAWETLSFQTQQWASRSWSMAVLFNSLGLTEEEFLSRSWSSRSWSLDEWLSRSWSSRSWSEEDWAYDKWLSRSWSSRSWSSRSWSSRSWSSDEWLSRSWSSRSWSTDDWASRSWSSRSWSSRSWSSRSWSDYVWESRSWSSRSWGSRSWSMMA